MYLGLLFVHCSAEQPKIAEDTIVLDKDTVKELTSGIKRGILIPLIEGLKSAVDCEYDPEDTTHSCHTGEVCLTEDCVRASVKILDLINVSRDPCDDFYEFSCGKWITNQPGQRIGSKYNIQHLMQVNEFISEEMKEEDTPVSVRKFLKAYNVCLNFDEYEPIHEKTIRRLLQNIGGMPLLEKDWESIQYDWTESFAKAFNAFKIKSPFTFRVDPNLYNTTENIIYIKLPLLDTFLKLKFDQIKQFAINFGKNPNETIQKDIEDMKRMEEFILKISKSERDILDEPEELKIVKLDELEDLFPTVNWKLFIGNIFKDHFGSIGHPLTKNTEIFIMGVSYVPKIIDALNSGVITQRTFANYLGGSFLTEFLSIHPFSSTEKHPVLTKQIICYTSLYSTVPFIVDYIYGKHRKGKGLDESVMKYSYDAMHELIAQTTWLDAETKAAVHEKLTLMTYFLNFAAFSQDPKRLDKFYEKLPEMTNNSIENQIAIEKFATENLLQRINVLNDRKEWMPLPEVGGTQTNAFHYADTSSIYIPAGIQIYPYFDPNRPQYLNFGGMGLILGHEITHGFDKTGRARDKTGTLREWWSEKSKQEFEKSAQCFVDQYNSFEYGGETNAHVDGKSTLSENIADNGGIRQAFLAYKLWEKKHGKEKTLPGLQRYTPYQLFFISFANSWCTSLSPEQTYMTHNDDSHSPDKYRIIGSVSNMKEFSEVFNCKVGSKMNPEKKCLIW